MNPGLIRIDACHKFYKLAIRVTKPSSSYSSRREGRRLPSWMTPSFAVSSCFVVFLIIVSSSSPQRMLNYVIDTCPLGEVG